MWDVGLEIFLRQTLRGGPKLLLSTSCIPGSTPSAQFLPITVGGMVFLPHLQTVKLSLMISL